MSSLTTFATNKGNFFSLGFLYLLAFLQDPTGESFSYVWNEPEVY